VENKGVVVDRKSQLFEGLVEFRFVGKGEVKNAVAFEAVEVVMGMGCGVEAVRGSQGENRRQTFVGQGLKGPIDCGEADLFALFSEGQVELLGRRMINAALELLEYAIALPFLLPVHGFHSHYKLQRQIVKSNRFALKTLGIALPFTREMKNRSQQFLDKLRRLQLGKKGTEEPPLRGN